MTAESAMIAVWLAWIASWLVAAAWARPAVARLDRRAQFQYRAVTVIGGMLLFAGYGRPVARVLCLWHTGPRLGWTMVGAAAAGFAFTWAARIHLGTLWSSAITRKAGHRVVDTGPYAIVRHPIYSGMIVAAAATAVFRGTGPAICGAALMAAGWFRKARLEETFLRAQFGPAYARYAERVPMLLPLHRR